MSLNNIKLTPQLLADFYATSLVEGEARPAPAKEPIAFLGNNGKRILVFVNSPNLPFLPDGELAFLTSILSACGLGLADVAVVNAGHKKGFDAQDALTQLQPKQVLLFDVSADIFGFAPADEYVLQSAGGLTFMTAPALKCIEESKEEKRRLWMALKTLFGL